MVTAGTTVAHGSFTEHVRTDWGREDIDARKMRLAQAIWEEGFPGGARYLNLLFFRSYPLDFWNPRVARHKKVYKSDVPAIVSAAEFKSEDLEILADDTEIVCAADVVMPCTHENFLAAWRLLHESHNQHLVFLSDSEEFVPPQYWRDIWLCTAELGTFIVDRCVAKILDALPADARMLWTGGFFDDADICCSVLEREGVQFSRKSP